MKLIIVWILLLIGVLWIGHRFLPENRPEGLLQREHSTPGTTLLIGGHALGVIVSPLPKIETLIWESAQKWDISYNTLYDLAVCESQLNPKAWGDHHTSFGLYQWKIQSWIFYNQLYGTELNILLPQDQAELTARVLKNGNWTNWFNCLKLTTL